MAREYSTKEFANDPLHTDRNGNPTSFLGFIDDFVGTFLFGNPDASSSIFGELTGYNSQQREFEQQEYLQDKMNEYNNPVNQMARLKAAGINPNTAAAGVAGVGNQSADAPQVNSNSAGASNALNALSGVANAVTGGVASVAKAAFDKGILNPTIEKLKGEAGVAFETAGLTSAQRLAAENYLQYMNDDQYLDLQVKRVNLDRYKQDLFNEQKRHYLIIEEINKAKEEVKVLETQQGVNAALEAKLKAEKLEVDENTRYQRWINDWCESNDIRFTSNTSDAILLDMLLAGKNPQDYCDSMIKFGGAYRSATAQAEYNADPFHNQYSELFSELDSLESQESEALSYLELIEAAKDSGEVSYVDYGRIKAETNKFLDEVRKSKKEVNRHIVKMNYSTGHASQLQNLTNDLIKIGVLVGANKALGHTAKPAPVKGYSR